MSLALPVFALCLSACEKPQIKTYRVEQPVAPESAPAASTTSAPDAAFAKPAASPGLPPAGTPPIASAPAPAAPAPGMATSMPGGIGSAPAVHALDWSAPADWQEQPARAMRRATYTASGAELSITSFPGDVGGMPANINRWRTQLALPSLPPEEAVASAEKLSIAGRDAFLVNIAGTGSGQMASAGGAPAAPGSANRTLGLILPFTDETWFFKLGGPDAAVATLEPQFRQFVATIHEHQAGSAPAAPSTSSGTTAATTPSVGAPSASGPQLAIQIPPGWSENPEKRPFRLATFTIPGPTPSDPPAELAITALSGPAGSLEENAERWWGELKAPAVQNPTSLKILPVAAAGGPFKIRILDLSAAGAPPAEGLLVGIVEYGEYTWFCKLKGPANLVESQRALFTEFLGKLALE